MALKVKKTREFADWLQSLTDEKGRTAIVMRIVRIESGLMGDFRNLGGKLGEFRVDVGPGYRLYFMTQGKEIILLLKGGDKGSQESDIRRAREMIAILEPRKTARKTK